MTTGASSRPSMAASTKCLLSQHKLVAAWAFQNHAIPFPSRTSRFSTDPWRKKYGRQTVRRVSDDDDNIDNSNGENDMPLIDPNATPLFDERATLFGLEPKADLDSLDNGLQFTGPIILLGSLYFMASLWFPEDVPPLN
ncbi:hypothetical protein HJC23_003177 [Cyclotella cryptica]|uniref:Uncharacterized protein n=1 Tax=Cyclotella cryptica TaxID=29204 RepID=A0ABD3PNN1_9STRA|eukprot:CCRYP_012850-RA/>CCRYP_012850-RA protein AED:0.31 eAED:0.31 QI:0/-1/0/1/-1/1/1/0/138